MKKMLILAGTLATLATGAQADGDADYCRAKISEQRANHAVLGESIGVSHVIDTYLTGERSAENAKKLDELKTANAGLLEQLRPRIERQDAFVASKCAKAVETKMRSVYFSGPAVSRTEVREQLVEQVKKLEDVLWENSSLQGQALGGIDGITTAGGANAYAQLIAMRPKIHQMLATAKQDLAAFDQAVESQGELREKIERLIVSRTSTYGAQYGNLMKIAEICGVQNYLQASIAKMAAQIGETAPPPPEQCSQANLDKVFGDFIAEL